MVVSEFRFKTKYMYSYLIPEAYSLDFEEIFRSSQSKYTQLVDAEDCTPGSGCATPATEPTLPAGYYAALPNEPVAFLTMMCQDIYTAVADNMSASTQATPYPPKGSGGRGVRSG